MWVFIGVCKIIIFKNVRIICFKIEILNVKIYIVNVLEYKFYNTVKFTPILKLTTQFF